MTQFYADRKSVILESSQAVLKYNPLHSSSYTLSVIQTAYAKMATSVWWSLMHCSCELYILATDQKLVRDTETNEVTAPTTLNLSSSSESSGKVI